MIKAKWEKSKLYKAGTSKCVIIPKEYVEMLNLDNGIEIIVTDKLIKIKPKTGKKDN